MERNGNFVQPTWWYWNCVLGLWRRIWESELEYMAATAGLYLWGTVFNVQ